MRVILYEATDAPPHLRFHARILFEGKLTPVGFPGPTPEVSAKAQAWWDAEVAKEQRKVAAAQATADRNRARAGKVEAA